MMMAGVSASMYVMHNNFVSWRHYNTNKLCNHVDNNLYHVEESTRLLQLLHKYLEHFP